MLSHQTRHTLVRLALAFAAGCFVTALVMSSNSASHTVLPDSNAENARVESLNQEGCNCPAATPSMAACGDLYVQTKDPLSQFRPDVKDRVISLFGGKKILMDDALFAMDQVFEQDRLWCRGSWLGQQFQQDGFDTIALQELVWRIQPDLIIDLGTNTGGSAIFWSHLMMGLPKGKSDGRVITIDLDEPTHVRSSIVDTVAKMCPFCGYGPDHWLWDERVTFIKGSTSEEKTLHEVKRLISLWKPKTVLVNHDASHTWQQIKIDLPLYADFVTKGSYLIVQDVKMDRFNGNKGITENAIKPFLAKDTRFEVDRDMEMFYYTQHPGGFLRRAK